jgi:uncharacterized protein involved in response to NO
MTDQSFLEISFFRPFILAAIATVLTAGAAWGAWLLWQIGFAHDFTGISLHHVNAHGHAQIFGWVGLIVIGFAGQAFPPLWGCRPLSTRLALLLVIPMVSGIVLRTLGMSQPEAEWAVPTALLGGFLETGIILIFVSRILLIFWRSNNRIEPYSAFVFTSLQFFFAQSVIGIWHMHSIMTAPDETALIAQVATWQAPLRDLQIHGFALFMIFGVHLCLFPRIFGIARISNQRAWTAYVLLLGAVLGEIGLFLAYRIIGNHVIAAFLMLPWLMLAAGCGILGWSWKFWKSFEPPDRSGKFIRTGWAWLVVSIILLLSMPVYQAASSIAFSHAYYGAIRHAITVGFISMMIMGVSARIAPNFHGCESRPLPPLMAPYLLVNTGCLIRVSTQILTDWQPSYFAIIGVSGILEVLGLLLWGGHIIRLMLYPWLPEKNRRESRETASTAGLAAVQQADAKACLQ